MRLWRRLGVDKLLISAYENGTVLSGISAGAICWFDSGHSDSMSFYNPRKWKYINVRGLGLIHGIHCPHYNSMTRGIPRRKHFRDMIGRTGSLGIAIENNCAMRLIDGRFYKVIASKSYSQAYRLYKSGRIVEKISSDRQTLLFSATLPPEIERLAAWVLHNPETVEIGVRRSPAETVTHAVYPVAAEQKFDLLIALLERTNFDSVLIFCRTKLNADRVAHFLKHAKHSVAILHSNRTQRERIEALEGFKSGKYEVMVATDIASRGLDIAGVSHVINYDVPEHPEDYVHRIGRTGRAQNVGDAFTLMNGEEVPALQAIEHFIGQKIPRLKLDNFPYLYTVLFEPESAGAGRRSVGGGRSHRGFSYGRRRK